MALRPKHVEQNAPPMWEAEHHATAVNALVGLCKDEHFRATIFPCVEAVIQALFDLRRLIEGEAETAA